MKKNKILLYLMILIAIILCIPSVLYLINNKTVDGFDAYYTYTLVKAGNIKISLLSGILVIGLLLVYSILYLTIIKKEKDIFKNKKQIITFIIVISIIFMMILPFLSSDIYYYIGDSWLCSKYHENPYYTTVKDLQDRGINDEILNNTGYWKNTVSVYGPLYNMFTILLSSFSFGSVTVALFIFKFASLIVHILNCYIIYKITKSNKYLLLYGLNPLILIELLSNVHNDIYLLMFMLLTIYFLVKKKNIYLTVIFLSLSIAIKYSTVLIIPFILLYYFRENTLPKKILYSTVAGIIIVAIVILLYMPFYRDISIFTNMLVQGNRYSQSILSLLLTKLNKQAFNIISNARIPIFTIIYSMILIKLLIKKDMQIKEIFKYYNVLMVVFVFLVLTNFQKWYILWLVPTIIWQNKNMRNFIINLTIMGIVPSFIFFIIENDSFRYGIYYSLTILILAFVCTILGKIPEKKEKKWLD